MTSIVDLKQELSSVVEEDMPEQSSHNETLIARNPKIYIRRLSIVHHVTKISEGFVKFCSVG